MDAVRAVVLTHGAGGRFMPLLESLQREGLPLANVVVVHNPSTPGEAPPPVPEDCELIAAPRNIGYTGGMNLGIARQLEHDGDLLLVLTHDARFHDGALEAMVEAARRDTSYGVIGPALVLEDSGEPFSFGGVTRANGERSHVRERPEAPGGIAPCDWIDGGTMLFRTDLMRRIGGFDARFFIYCEDAEICWRAAEAGARVGVVPDAVADQSPGGGGRIGPWSYLMTRNGAEFARRARGRRALADSVGRAARIAAVNLLRVIARGLRLRRGSPAEPWALTVGTARGAIDALRGRWGPPPPLPGAGDVTNVG